MSINSPERQKQKRAALQQVVYRPLIIRFLKRYMLSLYR